MQAKAKLSRGEGAACNDVDVDVDVDVDARKVLWLEDDSLRGQSFRGSRSVGAVERLRWFRGGRVQDELQVLRDACWK